MLKILKYHMSVISCYINLSIKRQIEYPAFMLSFLIRVPVQYFIGIWMIKVVTDNFQTLNGWDFSQLSFIYSLSLLSSGLMGFLFLQVFYMSSLVIKGEFDRMLLRPLGVFFQFIWRTTTLVSLFDLIPGIVIFSYACKQVNFVWSSTNIIKLILVIIGGVLIRASYFIITGSISFWKKNSSALAQIGHIVIERSTMYPLSIYPNFIQFFFTFILPFGFISFYPACEFLGKYNRFIMPNGLSFITIIVGIVFFLIGIFVFNRGLKAYESSGT